MNYDQTQQLSTDLLHLRNDTSGCDVKILVGREPNIKEFKAHSLILSIRSNYFKTAFSPQWASKEDGFFISNQPDISPIVFEVLLNLIYSGKFSVDNNENNEISFVDILIASDKLGFLEIYQHLEKRLLERESVWKIPKDFITIFQFREDVRFTRLYEVAIGLVCRNAKVIFDSKEFLEMKEEHLIQLLNRDDLKLEEIEIWDYLIKWGIENTDSILDEDSNKWTLTDFEELEKTLHNCIPYIRFSQMSPKVFEIVRKQYKNILSEDLVDDVLQYFTDPNTKQSLKNLPLRVSAYPLDSKIISAQDATTIASWIDKKKGIPYRLKDMPIKFELIYRASLENFSIDRFHKCCDNKGPTVVIIKVRNSGEIIGGYNPLDWRIMKENESIPQNNRDFYIDHKCKTSNSFIFSLSSLSNGVIPRLSQVKSKKEAIIWCINKGPCFGLQDLWIKRNLRSGKSKQKSYENKIIDSETFDIEEFEVFQIIDNRFSPLKLFKKACNFTGRIIKGTFQLMRRTIQSIIRFISNVERETYKKLFIGLSILGALAFLAFIIYKFIMASILTKILVVSIIAAITAIIILICNKC